MVTVALSALLMLPVLPSGPAPAPTRVLIMPVEPKAGVTKDVADQVTALITAEASAVPNTKVVSYHELESTLSLEMTRQVTACDQVSCASEIAGALDTDEVVIGTVGQVGKSYVLTLTRIRGRTGVVVGRVAERLGGDDQDAILDRLPGIVRQLFGTGAQAATPPAPVAEVHAAAPWVRPLRIAGVAAAAVSVTGILLAGALLAAGGGIAAYDLVGTGFKPRDHVVMPLVGLFSDGALVAGVLGVVVGLLTAATAGVAVGVSFAG